MSLATFNNRLRYVPIMETTVSDLMLSLRGETCPACSDRKIRRQTFCRGCYHELPLNLKRALYKRLGEGYEDAVRASAIKLLGSDRKLAIPNA